MNAWFTNHIHILCHSDLGGFQPLPQVLVVSVGNIEKQLAPFAQVANLAMRQSALMQLTTRVIRNICCSVGTR